MKILPAKTKSISPNPGNASEVNSQSKDPAFVVSSSMAEYDNLKLRLLITILALAGIFFVGAWWVFGLNIALNYLLGACVGVVYLGMLARSVDRLGGQTNKLGHSRLAIFFGLIIVAIFWEQLKILPVFIGFITYKAAILTYTIQELTGSFLAKSSVNSSNGKIP